MFQRIHHAFTNIWFFGKILCDIDIHDFCMFAFATLFHFFFLKKKMKKTHSNE